MFAPAVLTVRVRAALFARRCGVAAAAFWLVSLAALAPSWAYDPVDIFITEADSIVRNHDAQDLARYVSENNLLVGAAVHILIDAAIAVGDEGAKEDEEETLAFAERIARIHLDRGGSRAPLELVGVYRGWTEAERERRRRAKSLSEQATEARSARDFELAIGLLEQAREIYRAIGDSYAEAVVWGSLGVVYWYAGDYEGVLEQYAHALDARRAIDDRILEGRTLNGFGTVNYILERFDTAADYFRAAIELRRATGDLGGLGTSLTYQGNNYSAMGKYIDARDSYEQALEIVEQVGTPRQRFELLNALASLYSDMGRIRRSNEYYREALAIAVAEQDVEHEIISRMNIALNLTAAMDFRAALDCLDRVEELLADYSDPRQTIEFYRNRGLLYLEMGELDKAREDLVEFLGQAREHEAPSYEMDALIKIGYLYFELGAFDHALVSADSARALAERNMNGAMYRESHVLAAQVDRAAGRAEAALAHWKEALAQDEYDQAETRVLEDELGIANVTALTGASEEARELYRGLLPRVEAAGTTDLLPTIYLGIAHTFEASSPDSARHYNETALGIYERTRADIGGSEFGSQYLGGSKRYYYEEVARYYARVARTSGDARWSAEAFRTIERAKARGLLDLLASSLENEHSEAEEAVLDSIYRLDTAVPGYEERLHGLEKRYREIRDRRLDASAGALASETVVADIEAVRAILPKKTAMFVYALGDSASLLWAIDRDGHELHELPNRAAVQRDVGMLKDALVRPGSADDALRLTARRLYRTLVEPGAGRIAEIDNLVIVPDGRLFEIPFGALIETDPADGAGWGDVAFCAKRYAISYVPSVSVYYALHESRKKTKHEIEILAAGDPAYDICFESAGGALARLPYSGREVSALASKTKKKKATVLIGEAASEAAVKAELYTRHPRLLHLAAHGLIDPANPAASSIALCPGGGEDGYFHTLEILSVPLHTRLVVLSACESARGRIGRGEGVVGLPRAFIAAGATGVVSSLWAVSDESTSVLMQAFYHWMLEKKKPASRALREARMDLLADPKFAHPFHWSPFIVIGSERSPW
jgi:CHAT domain-containing protein/Tfp pilus assembly protein PilF